MGTQVVDCIIPRISTVKPVRLYNQRGGCSQKKEKERELGYYHTVFPKLVSIHEQLAAVIRRARNRHASLRRVIEDEAQRNVVALRDAEVEARSIEPDASAKKPIRNGALLLPVCIRRLREVVALSFCKHGALVTRAAVEIAIVFAPEVAGHLPANVCLGMACDVVVEDAVGELDGVGSGAFFCLACMVDQYCDHVRLSGGKGLVESEGLVPGVVGPGAGPYEGLAYRVLSTDL